MTESEWLSSVEPEAMLNFVSGRADEHKLRCFACACVRRIWDLLQDERSRKAIQVAEDFLGGKASQSDLETAAAQALDAADRDGDGGQEVVAAAAATSPELCAVAAVHSAAWARADSLADVASDEQVDYEAFSRKAFETEQAAQAALLRRIVGNPFDAGAAAQQ